MSLNSDLVASGLAEEVKGQPPPCEGSDGVRQRNVRFRWNGGQRVSVAGSFSDWREVSLNQRCEVTIIIKCLYVCKATQTQGRPLRFLTRFVLLFDSSYECLLTRR